jgi:hypothetical protein
MLDPYFCTKKSVDYVFGKEMADLTGYVAGLLRFEQAIWGLARLNLLLFSR